MREVETQTVGRDQRAALLNVRTQMPAQGRVQQVCCRVVARNVGVALGVHTGARHVTDARLALDDFSDVHDQPTNGPPHFLARQSASPRPG